MNIDIILLILALVCFIIDAFAPVTFKVKLSALGLALWVLSLLV